jgi:alkyl sulfatase BDS1-like metallo-beta-lactamase superfamily hydrolase
MWRPRGLATLLPTWHTMSGGVIAVQPHPQATREIAEANAGVRLRLPFGDTEDFDDARDQAKLGELLDPPDPNFAIVTP